MGIIMDMKIHSTALLFVAIIAALCATAPTLVYSFTTASSTHLGSKKIAAQASHDARPSSVIWEKVVSTNTQRYAEAPLKGLARTMINPMPTIPLIEDWTMLETGEVQGTVIGHPVFDDGTTVTTSQLRDLDLMRDITDEDEGHVVVTQSGSKYKLGLSAKKNKRQQTPKNSGGAKGEWSYDFFNSLPLFKPSETKKGKQEKNNGVSPPNSIISAADSILFRANGINSVLLKNDKKNYPISNGKNDKVDKYKNEIRSSFDNNLLDQKKLYEVTVKYNLTGQTIANGKYLLSGEAQTSTSGKSQIWTAYRSDPKTGLPIGKPVTIKLTDNSQAIRRESRNYKRIKSGLFRGEFVEKIEFLSDIEVVGAKEEEEDGGSSANMLEGKSVLVLEKGLMDLQEYMYQRDRVGLSSRAMRDAAHSAGKCIQAIHSSNMVWTDLKTDNFVVIGEDTDEKEGEPFVIKGIDLESAMPLRSNPVDYSPQACPPEFADAYISGRGHDFILDTSYDMWSLGMMLYELSTGYHYFAGETPLSITKALKNNFQADVSEVKDAKLRDLIQLCLHKDPKKRPTITQFLFHPYFLTSGIGSRSF
uniref:Protein kinase domain-containing protein n=1 Tax=Ditylum brightwellii TaxID=49249 RepID=A0A7S4UNE4_9STRA